MKRSNKVLNDELNRTRYSFIRNIMYCISNTAKCHFPLLWWCVLKILVSTLIPILTTILPKVVIEIVTTGQSIYKLGTAILTFMGSIAILSGADIYLPPEIQNEHFLSQTRGAQRADHRLYQSGKRNIQKASNRKFYVL